MSLNPVRVEFGELLHTNITDSLPISPTKREIGEQVDTAIDIALAAGYRKPRTITTTEELDALPFESVVKASDGNVWESFYGGWYETASRTGRTASDIALPVTVLYEPEATA